MLLAIHLFTFRTLFSMTLVCLISLFKDMNPLPHRPHRYRFDLPSMTLQIFLLVFLGDESLTTENTVIWNIPGMTLYVALYVVSGDESFATQSTLIWISPVLLFLCLFGWIFEINSLTPRTHEYNYP